MTDIPSAKPARRFGPIHLMVLIVVVFVVLWTILILQEMAMMTELRGLYHNCNATQIMEWARMGLPVAVR